MIAYKQVATVAKYAPGLDIIACGGITVPEHIVEAMMLGAKATETVTGVLYAGRNLLRRDIRFLTQYMKEQHYNSLEDFVGLGLDFIKPAEQLDFSPGMVCAEIDPLKCTGCGRCTDNICLATYLEDGVAKVVVEDCAGCGMCAALCPVAAASLKQRSQFV